MLYGVQIHDQPHQLLAITLRFVLLKNFILYSPVLLFKCSNHPKGHHPTALMPFTQFLNLTSQFSLQQKKCCT